MQKMHGVLDEDAPQLYFSAIVFGRAWRRTAKQQPQQEAPTHVSPVIVIVSQLCFILNPMSVCNVFDLAECVITR